MLKRIGRPNLVLCVIALSLGCAIACFLATHRQRGFELTDEARLLAANAKDPKVAASLEALALDPREPTSKRYVALRRLEDQAPGCALETADKLSTSPDELLRANAMAVLVRSHEPGAQDALERARRASPANDALASQLARANKKGGQ